jgi:hypothetical protein
MNEGVFQMGFLFCFVYFGLATHMLDAFRHYWREGELFSAGWNLAWGATMLLIGLAICLEKGDVVFWFGLMIGFMFGFSVAVFGLLAFWIYAVTHRG